jgi:nitrogen fixation negative regulator NifL
MKLARKKLQGVNAPVQGGLILTQLTASTKEKMAAALDEFFSSPPKGLPVGVLEAFGRTVKTDDGILPPRVFSEAVEQSSVAISITDTRAKILYTNQAFEKLTGYESKEVLGQNQSILSYKVTPPEVYQDLWNHLLNQTSWNGVLVNKRKDGKRYLADLTVAPVIGVGGKTSYYLALHRDVTEVHELEQQVRNQKVLIESMVDAAPVVMVLLNKDGKVILDNHYYKKLMSDIGGAEPAELFMETLSGLVEQEKDLIFSERRGFINQEVSFKNSRNVVTRWFSCSGVWVDEKNVTADDYFSDTNDSCMLLVANDITQQKHQQNKIKTNALRALMAEQQLVHAMRETLSAAIYQLQAPVNMTSAMLGMMERRQNTDKDTNALQLALADVIKSGERVLDTLQQSLPSESVEAVAPVNMNEVIKDVIDLSIYKLLGKSVLVDWEPERELPNINGRCFALRTLFKQLLDNAIDTIDEPGCTSREISVKTQYVDQAVEISICDSGPGIEADKRNTVFEPFFSGWENISGRPGMGLAIAMEMAQKHHGTIDIDTHNHTGCCMRVRLPINPPIPQGKEDA